MEYEIQSLKSLYPHQKKIKSHQTINWAYNQAGQEQTGMSTHYSS